MTIAYVGLGANIGDDAAILARFRRALEHLAALAYVESVVVSSVYRSDPVGAVRDQAQFLNAVARVELRETAPHIVLDDLLAIEASLGRVRATPGGPREIDLDLLLVDGERRDTTSLTLPHPRLTERAFVLLPLAELNGRGWCLPAVGEVVGDVLDRVLLAPNQACDVAAVLDDDHHQPGKGQGQDGV